MMAQMRIPGGRGEDREKADFSSKNPGKNKHDNPHNVTFLLTSK